MTGRARRNGKRMANALQAQQQHQREREVVAAAPTPRSADLPAVAQHPGLPPLDMDALTAPIMLSSNLAQPACPPRTPPAIQRQHAPPPREPLNPRRQTQPHAQSSTLSDQQYVSLCLLEALIRRDGEEALSEGAVRKCIERAKDLLRG